MPRRTADRDRPARAPHAAATAGRLTVGLGLTCCPRADISTYLYMFQQLSRWAWRASANGASSHKHAIKSVVPGLDAGIQDPGSLWDKALLDERAAASSSPEEGDRTHPKPQGAGQRIRSRGERGLRLIGVVGQFGVRVRDVGRRMEEKLLGQLTVLCVILCARRCCRGDSWAPRR